MSNSGLINGDKIGISNNQIHVTTLINNVSGTITEASQAIANSGTIGVRFSPNSAGSLHDI